MDTRPEQTRPAESNRPEQTRPADPPRLELTDRRLYLNRELSWLTFNERVLAEAADPALPLFERLKFLGIVSTNLDEFFMVRVAGLKQQLAGGVAETAADGMLPGEQLAAISERVHVAVAEQYRIWREEMVPLLAERGLVIPPIEKLSGAQRNAVRSYFTRAVFPALTPLAIDPGHPFPQLKNKSLNLAVFLRKSGKRDRRRTEKLLAVVQVPSVLPRLLPVPSSDGRVIILLEQLISTHVGDLFPGYDVLQTAAFRVTRNWDLSIDEEDSEDLLSTVQEELRRRDRGAAVRLQIDARASVDVERFLVDALNLSSPADVYRVDGPLQLSDLAALTEFDLAPELRNELSIPAMPTILRDADSVMSVIGKRDIALHHPYESFEPVARFLSEAADDPCVLAIKQTLYRTSGDSPFVRALGRAAENGKQVTVLVEIKARFDEANNIAWARRLEESGVHVVYGLIGLKTHCKLALVVRREGELIRRYVHLGTGNYNPQTARLYTDLSLFTTREEVADDVSALFNLLTGFAEPPKWRRLVVAPFGMRDSVIERIEREAACARRGEPARILAKMNSLVDPAVIRALYAASQSGVDIDLLVRGICCLKPGVPGVSDRIRVRSIVDRYLEHSRLFAFGEGDRTELLLSSADWMPRNFQRRIEVMVPVEDKAIRARLLDEVLGFGMRDNVKARMLETDGTQTRVPSLGEPFQSQVRLLEVARAAELVVTDLRQAAAPAEITAAVEPRAGSAA
ncbi:MAG TPA: polyphosphate kinase 1 [Kofleriaceae bacterium]|nr:polyphosphate kinase 1 [Kofleriaceae bacterium]